MKIFYCLAVLVFTYLNASAQSNVELMLQKGHRSKINEIIFTPSGKQLISCSDDNTVKIWDVESGKELKTLTGHTQQVKSIAINRDGSRIFSGGNKKEKKVIFWDAKTGAKRGELTSFEGELTEIEFSRYGNRIAILESLSGFQTKVSVWDEALASKRFDIKLPSDFYANTICFHPGNNHLMVGGKFLKKKKTESIMVYNSEDGSLLQQLKGTSTNVAKLIYSRKGNMVVAVGTNIQVWFNAAGDYRLEKTIDINGSNAMIYDDEQQLIFSKGNDLIKWDLKNNVEISRVDNAHSSSIRAVNLTYDENNFVTAANDNQIFFWDKESLTKIPHFSGLKPDQVSDLNFSWNYKQLFTAVDAQKLQYWNVEKAKLDFLPAKMSRRSVPSDVQNANDKHEVLICGTQNKGVEIWNMKNQKQVAFLKHTSFVSQAIAVPNTSLIAGLGRDKKILLWDKGNLENAPMKMAGHTSTLTAIAVSPDGKFIYTGSKDKTMRVWSIEQKTLIHSIKTGLQVNSIAISPDGMKIVTACGTTSAVYGTTSPSGLYIWNFDKLSEYATAKKVEKQSLEKHAASVSKVIFSRDGSKIYSSGYDNMIYVWDVTSGSLIKSLEGHSADVKALVLSKQDQYLLSGSDDATIKYWNVDQGESVFNTVTFDNGSEFINYDQNNYYSCTKNGAKNVHFVLDDQVFLFEQFDLRLNRPDIVYANLPGVNKDLLKAYNKAYKKRLRKMNFTEDMLSADFHIPELKIINADDYPYQVTQRDVNLKIKASDELYLLDRINVWINDVPIYGKEGIDLRSKSVKILETDLSIKLGVGKNKIQISVLNQKGAESFKSTKFIYYQSQSKKNDLYVVGIGVSTFNDASFNLDYASKDATDVVDYFKKDQSKYNNVYTKLITNEQATRSNILLVKDFLKGSKIDDNVIVFIASHGLLDEELDYYLATTNVNFYKPSEGGLIYDDLEGLLDGIPARKKLLLIDACHSGEVDDEEKYRAPIPDNSSPVSSASASEITGAVKSRGFKRVGGTNLGMASTFELMKEMFNDLRRGSGATVISSAGGKEFALESAQWNNGVFTYSFLEGLESKAADKDGDSNVDLTEIRNYVADNVKKLTNGQQNPTFRKENLDNNYNIW
ncbi:WD40 domain-containing protein [Reichenbachiella versicolor]|uniref:WD40 domain-containing protein n=1 Tax=Reichenbachiella versicolor TaxID=1821036 RepID=UPI000D6E104F|nr:caspase family protein [Reichenbachiella versicolor]